ncbi:hypothetical protein V2J09_008509 [Rumex salicifolius]
MSTKTPESSSTAQQGESQAVQPPQTVPQDSQQTTRTGNTVKSGPLLISSKGIGWTSWKKRWFILTTNSLIFYRNDPNAATQRSGEINLILGGIDLNNSGSVEAKPDKKLITVLFSDARDGRAFTLKAETLEDLHEWKSALETALAQAPSASAASGPSCVLNNGEQTEDNNSPNKPKESPPAVKYLVIGRPVLLALEEADGTPSFLEKALIFIEDHGVKTEGILRQAADVEDVERRVHEYEQGKTDFSPEEDAHHVLRELPSSPVPASCCTALLEAFKQEEFYRSLAFMYSILVKLEETERSKRANAMRIAILETFPEPNRKLLQRLLVMMQAVIAEKQVNRMSTSAVAACMAPLLLRPLLAGDCEVENQHFEMAGDSSLQLLQAAAAANHAQGIIIALLDEYDKIFGNANQGSALSSELFSEEEGEDSGTEGETEYDDDEYEDDDNDYESDEEDDEEYGSEEEEGETEDDDCGDSVDPKDKVKKNLDDKSVSLSPDDEKEIERLEAVKKDLEMQIAAEAKGKESLHSILASRKKALHERRLALERDVVKMTEQLQNERDLQAALDGGLGISQAQNSANVDEKIKTEPKEMNAEDGKQNQKQRLDDLGMQQNQQSEDNKNSAIMSDRCIHPPETQSQDMKSTNKPKINEPANSSHKVDKSAKSKGQLNIKADGAYCINEKRYEPSASSNKIHSHHVESSRSVSMKVPGYGYADAGISRPMTSSVSKRFNSKTEEKRNQIANELQNLDKGAESGHSPKKAEKGKGQDRGNNINKKQEGNVFNSSQQNSDKKSATEANSTSNNDGSKKSVVTKSATVAHIDSDRGKTSEGNAAHHHHHQEKPKSAESRSMRKRMI